MFDPPAMPPQQVADCPIFAPAVRITCYQHGCTLFVGDDLPEGGAEAVAEAAGCPGWTHGADPDTFVDCPVPVEIERLREEASAPIEVLPAPLPPIVSNGATGAAVAAPARGTNPATQ